MPKLSNIDSSNLSCIVADRANNYYTRFVCVCNMERLSDAVAMYTLQIAVGTPCGYIDV